jgi:predicted HicB family RNase H-like nuclease
MKTLKISEKTHTRLKIYCAKNKLKLNEWADNIINIAITNEAKKQN